MQKKGLNSEKSEKNRGNVGGWRIGPNSRKNWPKKGGRKIKNQTGPAEPDRPVRLNRFSWTGSVFKSPFPSFPRSSSSPFPWPPTQRTHSQNPIAHLAPLSLSTPFSLLQHNNTEISRTTKPPNPEPQNHSLPTVLHQPTVFPNPSTTTNTRPRPTLRWPHLNRPAHHHQMKGRDRNGLRVFKLEATPLKGGSSFF